MRNKKRIPLQPRAHLTAINPKQQKELDKELDEEFEKAKIEYARKYGQSALEDELRRKGLL